MATQELKRINAYRMTNADINDAIAFINSGYLIFPAGLNARQRANFNRKFGAASGFIVAGGELRYNPNANINVPVARPANRLAILQNIYNLANEGLGKGLESFYKSVAMQYLTIPKQITSEFLKTQGDYIVAKVPQKQTTNASIVTSVPNERWGIDLIDMSQYQGWNTGRKYIMTVVDYFSGKCWARAILNRNNNPVNPTLSNAINDICVNEAHTIPHIIQTDNEFSVGSFRTWCNNHQVRLIATSPYTPNSNGKVERMNREIRRKMKAGFIRNNDYVWLPRLQTYVDNINNQYSTITKLAPNQLWTQGYNPHQPGHIVAPIHNLNDGMNMAQRQAYQESGILHRAHAALVQIPRRGRRPPFQVYLPPAVPHFNVGDLVRIKMLAVTPELRDIKEHHLGWNRNVVHYTPEVFRIHGVYNYGPQNPRKTQYSLENLQLPPQVIMNSRVNFQNVQNPQNFGNAPRLFFYNELTRVPPNHVPSNILPPTRLRALQLARYV